MSQWKCKSDDGESGPVSFKELAELLREGKVKQGGLVCREGSPNWEPAWHVPGLMNAAGMTEPGDSIQNSKSQIQNPSVLTAAVSRIADASDDAYATAPSERRERGKVYPSPFFEIRAGLAGLVGMVVTGIVYRWAYWKMMAFPPPRRGGATTYWFPLFGECGELEYVLLYVDLFAAVAAAAWWMCGPLVARVREATKEE